MTQTKKIIYYYITVSDYLVSVPGKTTMLKLSRRHYKGREELQKEVERQLKRPVELRFQTFR